MGHFNFKWPHSAEEVYVTGTFDDWAKSQKLEKTAAGFEKTVQLPQSDEKILYKFVVDGNWTTDHLAPSETDHQGNVNNILLPEHILSSVGPTSTTTALAGQVPLEKDKGTSSDLPGTFPETPANESQNFSVNPIPASSGAGNPVKLGPGEKVPPTSSFTSNTLTNNVTLDKESYEKGGSSALSPEEQVYSVKPLPPTIGAGNPITLAPGEKVPPPSSYTTGTTTSNVKLDEASYENSGSAAPQLPQVLNKQEKAEAGGDAIFAVPPVGGTMIPESSLPMGERATSVGDPSISSVGPESTTAKLAGQQPIQPRGVPEVVSESQQQAHAAPEASSSPEAVAEKSQVEKELKQKVPEASTTSESGVLGKSEKGYVAAAAGGIAAAGAAVGAAAVGAAYSARDKAAEATGNKPEEVLPRHVQDTLDGAAAQANPSSANTTGVPEIVKESQKEAHASPEASASPVAVQEKSAVEQELEQKVKPTEASGEPAPTQSAALASTAPVKPTTETTPAPGDVSSESPGRSLQVKQQDDSRDISPMSRPGEPSAATGRQEAGTSSTITGPTTPKKTHAQDNKKTPQAGRTPGSETTTTPSSEAKKNKRKSFFGKIKEKLKS